MPSVPRDEIFIPDAVRRREKEVGGLSGYEKWRYEKYGETPSEQAERIEEIRKVNPNSKLVRAYDAAKHSRQVEEGDPSLNVASTETVKGKHSGEEWEVDIGHNGQPLSTDARNRGKKGKEKRHTRLTQVPPRPSGDPDSLPADKIGDPAHDHIVWDKLYGESGSIGSYDPRTGKAEQFDESGKATPAPVREENRRVPLRERKANHVEHIEKTKEWFRKNYSTTGEDGSITYDIEAIRNASPEVQQRFYNMLHWEDIRTGRATHAPGAREHMYRRAHYTGGVVVPDPKRPGQFYVADKNTGQRVRYNPAASERMRKTDQLLANRRRIAANPEYYKGRMMESARRNMRLKARRLWRQGDRIGASMMMLNIDDPNHPAVLLNSGAFATRDRYGMRVNQEAYAEYAKQYFGGQANLTPEQQIVYNKTRSGSTYQAEKTELNELWTAKRIDEAEYNRRITKLETKADEAEAQVKSFQMRERPKAGTLHQYYMPTPSHGRAWGVLSGKTNLPDHLKRYHQEWLSKREDRYDPARRGGYDMDLPGGGVRRVPGVGTDAYGREVDPNMRAHGPDMRPEWQGRDRHHLSLDDPSLIDAMIAEDKPIGGSATAARPPSGSVHDSGGFRTWPDKDADGAVTFGGYNLGPYTDAYPPDSPLSEDTLYNNIVASMGSDWYGVDIDGTTAEQLFAALYQLQGNPTLAKQIAERWERENPGKKFRDKLAAELSGEDQTLAYATFGY